MKKINLTLATIFLAVSILIATDFFPKIRLSNIVILNDNQLDFYQFEKGFSISEHAYYSFEDFRIITSREFYFEEGFVKLESKFNSDISLFPPIYLSLDKYLENNFRAEFRTILQEKAKQSLGDEERSESEGLIPEIIIELPKIALPKAVRKLMGNKAGRLSLDGSTKVTISGNSYYKDTAADTEAGNNKKFGLDMKQDLNLSLKGTIGEKIHINVSHRSSTEDDFMAQPTEVNIKYIGLEDEVVKTIEAGNINLSLSGSQYITYSASSEGLFGVKTELEAGNLKITSIIGKDEAKKNSKKYNSDSTEQTKTIRFDKYEKYKYYYVHDPLEYLAIYNGSEEDAEEGYANNAILLEEGEWIVYDPGLLPTVGSLKIYVDDSNASNDFEYGAQDAYDTDNNGPYSMHILIDGTDYFYDLSSGIITFSRKLSSSYSIGVVYTDQNGTEHGSTSPLRVKIIQKKNNFADALMLKNVYSLGNESIKTEDFEFRIYVQGSDGNEQIETIPYSSISFIDYFNIDENGDGFIDASDVAINFQSGIVIIPFIEPFAPLPFDLPAVYESEYASVSELSQYYLYAKGNIGRDTIDLGDMNIMPGTVKVRVTTGGETLTLTEGIDYIVDYDFGNVTLTSSKGKASDAKIEIDYQFKPLFSVESKTIYGMRADYQFNDNLSFGSTVVYESEKVNEDRPKIGSENRNLFVADLDGRLQYDVPFLTRLVDFLPFIRTDEDSQVSLNGEIAVSIPRIYGSDKQHDDKESYLDDMESILDIFPLGVSRPTWTPASRPEGLGYGATNTIWFNPKDIHARDVYNPETLTEDEEKETVTTLSLLIKPDMTEEAGNVGNANSDALYWGGVMKYIGNQVDFSKKQYIEILTKVDTLSGPQPTVIMHLDLGSISEDYYDGDPTSPDTEDNINVDGLLDAGEDTGLDGIVKNGDGDTETDDFNNDKETYEGHEIYPDINKTELNNSLDSEDLDNDGQLNRTEVYFGYAINISNNESEYYIDEFNGYRLFRIPLEDEEAYYIYSNQPGVTPNLEKISFSRLWFEVEKEALVRIVNLDIVGNKWEEQHIFNDVTGEQIFSESEQFQSGIIDNQKETHYKPAPHTMFKNKEGEKSLEQSLIIDYSNLQPDHVGLTRQLFFNPTNINKGLNLLNYNKIRFWLYPESESNSQTDSLIVRFASDSLNYYEMRIPLEYEPYHTVMIEEGWHEIEISFNDLTFMKNDLAFTDSLYNNGIYTWYHKEGREYRMYRTPTLSNLKLVYLGMKAGEEFNGRIYIDDIRVADPYEATGWAARTTFHTSFADFATLDLTMKWLTPNFQTSINRKTNPSYNKKTEFNITNRYNLHKFFPTEWGLSIPLTLSRVQSKGIPLYKANSDILRANLNDTEKEQQKNNILNYTAGISFSQSKQPKSKILAYTLKNTSITASVALKRNSAPTSTDTTLTYNLEHNYNLSLEKKDLEIGLWSDYKFYFFPHTFNNKIIYKADYPNRWRWVATADTIPHWEPQTQTHDVKTVNTTTTVKYDLTSDISTSYSFKMKRDLMLDGDEFRGVNLGREMNRNQDIDVSYDPDYMDRFFTFDSDLDISYHDTSTKTSTTDTTGVNYKLSGGIDRDIGVGITLKNRDILESLVRFLDKDGSIKPGAGKPGAGKSGSGKSDSNKYDKDDNGKPEKKDEDKRYGYNPGSKDLFPERKDDIFGGKDREIIPANRYDETEEKPEEEKSPAKGKDDDKKDEDKIAGDETTEDEASGDDKPDKDDTKEKVGSLFFNNPLLATIVFLSKFDNLSIDYDNKYGHSYKKIVERPSYVYQIWGSDEIDEEFFERKTLINDISASSGMQILENLSTNVSGSIKSNNNKTKNSHKLTTTKNFPSITLQLTGFEKLLRIEKILTSSRLTSSFSRTKEKTINKTDNTEQSNSERLSFSPLISWNGNWLNNITSNTSVSYTEGDTDNKRSETKYHSWSGNGNVSWSFSAAKGIKIPLLGKIQFQNELTTSLDVNVESSVNYNIVDDKETKQSDDLRFTISPGASYKFSRNINGGLDASYEKRINNKKDETITTFRLGIWVEAQF